jgi:hypothetical protein
MKKVKVGKVRCMTRLKKFSEKEMQYFAEEDNRFRRLVSERLRSRCFEGAQ